jgi:hypothetical protein
VQAQCCLARAGDRDTLVDVDKPRDKPIRLWFAPFRCPRCKHETSYTWLHSRLWKPIYWCENCGSYFVTKNNWLVGLAYGISGAVVLVLIVYGPLYPWFQSTGVSNGWLMFGAVVLATALSWVLWGLFLSRFITYEYIGRHVN